MPNKTLSHIENCAKVCLLCFQKVSDMVPARRGLILARIWKYFIEKYDPNEEQLTSAVCARCRQILLKIKKGEKTNNDLPDAFDFSKIILTTFTRSNLLC